MDFSQLHSLAVAYAEVKLSEFQAEHREAIASGNIDFSAQEVQYLKSAYDFAVKNLSE